MMMTMMMTKTMRKRRKRKRKRKVVAVATPWRRLQSTHPRLIAGLWCLDRCSMLPSSFQNIQVVSLLSLLSEARMLLKSST